MEAVGHVAALWAWAIDNAPDGRLPIEDEIIAEGAYWFDNPARFIEALIFCGFVDDDYDGHRQIHDWEEWAGALIRKRESDKERIRLQRCER